MNSVKEIALCFCATAVFCAGVSVLSGKALEKSGRYIIALILLCSVIGTVSTANLSIDLLPQNTGEQESISAAAISGFAAEYLIANLLSENQITFEKITATVSKNQDGGIVISEIEIKGATNPEKIRALLLGVGIDCGVIFS